MVNYVLSFCKITAASKIFSRNFYLPLLKPLTPKEALRTFRITGKWLLGAKIQHYIPVLLNHKNKRSKRAKAKPHKESEEYTYMAPVFDADNENHKLLLTILDNKEGKGVFVYTVEDKKYNIVLQSELERAILDGDVVDVLVSQKNDKLIVKLKNLKKIPVEIQYYENKNDKMFWGEGATSPEEEKFHHHGRFTMGLAKIFEDKELLEEKWEEELKKLMRRRKRQAKEGSKEWKEMMKESMKNLDWNRFEEEAKKIIEEIDEPALEQQIDMEIDDLSSTKHVNETFLQEGPELLEKLPTLKEIPDIIKNMGNAVLDEIESTETNSHRVSGVKIKLSSGKDCFVSGQIVHTEDGDVFVPGQTIESEFGLEYTPGITINIDNKPTLINGLIMGDDSTDPLFIPTQSTITADGQLTFATVPEERPKPNPEKKRKIEDEKQEPENQELELEIECDNTIEIINENSNIEESDAEAERLKSEQQKLELEKLKMMLLDDGLDDIISSIEDKRTQLKKKLEELRRLNANENSVTYISDKNGLDIAGKISNNSDTINRLSDILIILTKRAATFRDRNNVRTDNINHDNISVSNPTDSDVKFNDGSSKLKILLKTVTVALNNIFKSRPRDEMLALNMLGEIFVEFLKDDDSLLRELLDLMNTPSERSEICASIFKQLTQNVTEMKVSVLNSLANTNLSSSDVINCVEKILGKQNEVECDAFVKIVKLKPELATLLTGYIQAKMERINSEKVAAEFLVRAIESSVASLIRDELRRLFDDKCDLTVLKCDALAFARALGLEKEEEILTKSVNISEICDKSALDLLQRTILMGFLSKHDNSLKSAIDRLKKNPERSRKDPRIRQIIRESAQLQAKDSLLKNSREIPVHLIKNSNILAIEDTLLRKSKIEYPVQICRNSLQIVIPKEAEKSVLSGKIPYTLIDESGIASIKPIHTFSALNNIRVDKPLNGAVHEKEGHRKYLQAKSNVRKLKQMFRNSRQVA